MIEQYKEQVIKNENSTIENIINEVQWLLPQDHKLNPTGVAILRDKLESLVLKSIDGAYENVYADLREEIFGLKVIMWSDDSAQHIRNIQNNDTIEKVLSLLTPKEK